MSFVSFDKLKIILSQIKKYIDEKTSNAVSEVNEETFVFKKDMYTSVNVGDVKVSSTNPRVKVASENETFESFWNNTYDKELDSTITYPTCTLTDNKNVTEQYEIGTTINDVNFKASFNTGSYTYGPSPTGVIASGYSFGLKSNMQTVSSNETTVSKIVITNSEITYKYTINYNEGDYAKTNHNATSEKRIEKGNCSDELKIKAGDLYVFYGYSNNDDGSDIRSLFEGNKFFTQKASTKTFRTPAYSGAKETYKNYVIAIPASCNYKVKSVQNSSFEYCTDSFNRIQNRQIKDASNVNTHDYKIWVFSSSGWASAFSYFDITLEQETIN